jgi:hypothetical protein
LVFANVLSKLRPLRVGERGRLVHDRLGLGLEHGLAHRARVEQVEPDRLRAEPAQQLAARAGAVRPDDVMAFVDQLGNEPAADRAARAGDEYAHRWSSLERVWARLVP